MSSSSNWKIHDLGASRHGLIHWWMQRITALALMPLSGWLVFSLVLIDDYSYQNLANWIAQPLHSILLISVLLAVYYHAMLGLQTIFEDYIHPEWLRITAIISSNLVLALLLIASVFSVFKIAFQL
ncbi:MAG: succinate dehydrogenase, hydrophobic membrane anchor protein [Gammaproteobacteria bacterium]|nr:succinate dehydrogenase, hydrophobic membrane anchor protein [Gammaproteobacteria bacterium]